MFSSSKLSTPLDPALAGFKDNLPWYGTQQGPEMGRQLYPQQLPSTAAVQAQGWGFKAGAWLPELGCQKEPGLDRGPQGSASLVK